MAIATINPATGQVVKTFESLSDAQIEVKLQKAADTFLSYRKVPFAERAQMMLRAAAILDCEKESFARTMTTEMGKTFRSAVDEASKRNARGCAVTTPKTRSAFSPTKWSRRRRAGVTSVISR